MNPRSTLGIKTGKLKHFSADEVGFFEGPEKLLEIWFDLGPEESKGLRIISKLVAFFASCLASCTCHDPQ